MSFNRAQFENLIQRTLKDFDPALYSLAALNLELGTSAQESAFGTYFRQKGGGPALGAFQIEPPTFRWLQRVWKKTYPEIADWRFEELEWCLRKSIIMARLRYRVVRAPLPPAADVHAMAKYWKKWFNTYKGHGTVKEFEKNYRRYVA